MPVADARVPDVCLLLEGTYPYISGGVSSWVHGLIEEQKHLSFYLVSLVPTSERQQYQYTIPDNVIGHHDVVLNELPRGKSRIPNQTAFFQQLRRLLLSLYCEPGKESMAALVELFSKYRRHLGHRLLLNSPEAWDLLQEMYSQSFSNESFLDFFWSWRGLHEPLFSTLLCDLPEAKVYHSLATGYGGLVLARAAVKGGQPTVLTEHGIYTNERRIEIASADWLVSHYSQQLGVEGHRRDLRDLWVDRFTAYSKICYDCATTIVTLFEGNQTLQRQDGATDEKLMVIPNGIDCSQFSALERNLDPSRPTIAMAGRVVSIKDVKTFLRGCAKLRVAFPNLRVWILGPTDEEPEYYRECVAISRYLDLGSCVSFEGKVSLKEYFPKVDVLVMTSISEAQPLVLLEAAAAGVPCVATDVGDCKQLLNGRDKEDKDCGPSGMLCALADPADMARCVATFLNDKDRARRCGEVGRERALRYYDKSSQQQRYHDLYHALLNQAAEPAIGYR